MLICTEPAKGHGEKNYLVRTRNHLEMVSRAQYIFFFPPYPFVGSVANSMQTVAII